MPPIQINSSIYERTKTEFITAGIGITATAVCNVAIRFFASSCSQLPYLMNQFLLCSYGAIAICGTVMAVHSAIRICQKVISKDAGIDKALIGTTLGCVSTALIQATSLYLMDITPSLTNLKGHSLAYWIGTNLVLQASVIAGAVGILFSAYAACRTGQMIAARFAQAPSL